MVIQYSTIRGLRDKIAITIEDYLRNNALAKLRFAREGEEFHFMKSVSFVIPTNYIAHDLKEFVDILKKITIDSIYFHIFEAHLRLEKGDNDFSNWIKSSVGDKELADEISGLDPYTQTLDGLRNTIVKKVEQRIL